MPLAHPLPVDLAELIARRFRALGEPMRIRLLDLLRDSEATELLPEHFAPRDIDGAAIQGASPAEAQPLGTRWQRVHADRATLEELEKDVLRQALGEAGGVVAYAARALGIARTTLASRLEALGIRAAKGPPR